MASHLPPVPPEQRSPKGPGHANTPQAKENPPEGTRPEDRNAAEQGRQGNVNQNTRNTGYQQDR